MLLEKFTGLALMQHAICQVTHNTYQINVMDSKYNICLQNLAE